MTKLIPRSRAAIMMGCTAQTLLRRSENKIGPVPLLINKRWYYDQGEIEQFLSAEQEKIRTRIATLKEDE